MRVGVAAIRKEVVAKRPVEFHHTHTGVAGTPGRADCIGWGALYIAAQLVGTEPGPPPGMRKDCTVEDVDPSANKLPELPPGPIVMERQRPYLKNRMEHEDLSSVASV